jgi:hypothetical protein
MIVNGRGQDAQNGSQGRRPKSFYQLSGSVYELFISGLDSSMKVNWLSKIDYKNLWQSNLLAGVERRLFYEVGRAGGTVKLNKAIIGRTCLSVHRKNQKPIRYNAHPNYRSGLPWYDWVMLDWGNDGIIPARIFMILETTALGEDDFVYYGNEHVPQQNLINQTSLLKPNSIYIVVRSAEKEREPHNETKFKYASRLSYHITLEEDYTIVNASCIHGPAYVIANAPYGDETKAEDIKDFIVVKDMKEWSEKFINRDDTEYFGRVNPQNVE